MCQKHVKRVTKQYIGHSRQVCAWLANELGRGSGVMTLRSVASRSRSFNESDDCRVSLQSDSSNASEHWKIPLHSM